MFRKLILPFFILLVAFGLTACGNNEKSEDQASKTDQKQTSQNQENQQQQQPKKGLVDKNKTVATVNDEKIKGKQYNQVLQQNEAMAQQQGQDVNDKKALQQMKKQVIDSLVSNQLLIQDADKKGYKASKKQVDNQLNKVKKQYGNNKKFKQALQKSDMSMDQFQSQLKDSIKMDKYTKKEVGPVTVSNDKVKSYYKKLSANNKKAPKFKKMKPQIKKQLKQQKQQKQLLKIADKLKKKGDVDVKI